MIKPYYQDEWVTIYNTDCRNIILELPEIGLVLTDPPYPNMTGRVSQYQQCSIDILKDIQSRQLIFWHAEGDFPLTYQAIHIWDKKVGCQSEYERIFERNSTQGHWHVFREYLINSTVAAKYGHDIYTGHPSQKPFKLITKLIQMANKNNNLILDPFLGSGTTCYCAKKLNIKSIGIEIEEKYCEMAAKRLQQSVFDFTYQVDET